jgi:hypothetical protein
MTGISVSRVPTYQPRLAVVHCGQLPLKDLPDWDWREISAHFRCTKCGTVGHVDTRADCSEVIDFNKGIG